MSIARTILAALISLSVAILPAAGGIMPKSPSRHAVVQDAMLQDSMVQDELVRDDVQGAMEMSAAEQMDDCCPHAVNPCDGAAGDCSTMAACALKCFNFVGSVSSPLIYERSVAKVMPLFEGGDFRSQAGSPPFR